MLIQIEFVSYLVGVLNQSNSGLIRPDFEQLDEFPDESKHLVLEDVRADRARAVDEEHQVGLLLGTGGLHCAHSAGRQVRVHRYVHETVVALQTYY